MDLTLYAVGAALAAVLLVYVLWRIVPRQDPRKKGTGARNRAAAHKDVRKRLAQNPKDPDALQTLADMAFEEQDFPEAFRDYGKLIELIATTPGLDEFHVTLRHALSAVQLKRLDTAYKELTIARSLREKDFEVNYNLGSLEYGRKAYPKALVFLREAYAADPENAANNRLLGLSLFRTKAHMEATRHLRNAVEMDPDSKELQFALAQCLYHQGQNEQALRLFIHLRADPTYGPHASLAAGSIHAQARQFVEAVADFKIGLRHEKVTADLKVQLLHRLAATYLQDGDLTNSIRLWETIEAMRPGYQDVPALLRKYREISANRHLRSYLISSMPEFLNLCKLLATNYFDDARVKILDLSHATQEYADVLVVVSTNKWEEQILFRFVRSSGNVGDFLLREMYARIKEVRAQRGVCATAEGFTDEAKSFVEARLIDLVEKGDLVKQFAKLSASGQS